MNALRFGVGKPWLLGAAMALGATLAARAGSTSISMPAGSPYPEGLTAASDGTLYASSLIRRAVA